MTFEFVNTLAVHGNVLRDSGRTGPTMSVDHIKIKENPETRVSSLLLPTRSYITYNRSVSYE
jgi:hypothetical protein